MTAEGGSTHFWGRRGRGQEQRLIYEREKAVGARYLMWGARLANTDTDSSRCFLLYDGDLFSLQRRFTVVG